MSFYAFGRALFTIIKYNKPPLADGDDTGHYQYDDDSNSDDSSDRYDYDESSTIRFGWNTLHCLFHSYRSYSAKCTRVVYVCVVVLSSTDSMKPFVYGLIYQERRSAFET